MSDTPHATLSRAAEMLRRDAKQLANGFPDGIPADMPCTRARYDEYLALAGELERMAEDQKHGEREG